MRRLVAALVIVCAAAGAAVPLIAQESQEAEKSMFLNFVEDRISAPGRRISINGLEGALSSNVAIGEITISDSEGVWLRITDAQLDWNQSALLGGRLQINELSAGSIDYVRPAIPPEGVTPPAPEATGLQVPEFPVAVVLEQLSVPSVTFGEDVFGLGSEIALDGRLVLEGGSLDTNLDIERLDGPGGTLQAAVAYDKETEEIDLDLTLTEPEDGVVANLLDLQGRPGIEMRIKGSGPYESLAASMTLDADGERALTGLARLERASDGLGVRARLNGPIADLVAPAYRPFFGAETRLTANALLRDGGGFALNEMTLSGGQLNLTASADTTTDGFLRELALDAEIAGPEGGRVLLPVAGAGTTIGSARAVIDYGRDENWTGSIRVEGLDTGDLATRTIALDLNGAAVNIGEPENRRVTFNADGTIDGISTDDPRVADALGDSAGIGIAGLWEAGGPIRIVETRLEAKALTATLEGEIDDFVFDGGLSLDTPSLAPFSGLAGRQLSGTIDLSANGTLEFLTGGFDLALDGTAENLGLGVEAVNNMLTGTTRLTGRVGRSEAGVTADAFRIASNTAEITADGTFSSTDADFDFSAALDDIGQLSDAARGALTIEGSARGQDGPIALDLAARVPNGRLLDRPLSEAALTFSGSLNEGAFAGSLTGEAFLDRHRVSLQSQFSARDGVNRLSALEFETAGTRLTGNLTRDADGLLTGNLDLDADDVSTAAALFLTEASGAARADIELSRQGESQTAQVTAAIRDFAAAGTTIGQADVSARIADMFAVPAIEGTINGVDITAAGIDVTRLEASASHSGDTTDFTTSAALDNGTDIDITGALSPEGDGYRLALDRARLAQGELSARLAEPTALAVTGESVTLDEVQLAVGSGRITASGTAGRTLDLGIEIRSLPLAIANTIRPDLGMSGTVQGMVDITGEASAPQVAFEVSGNGISAAQLEPLGASPLRLTASGRFANDTLSLSNAEVNGPAGLSARASGTMPLVGSNGRLNVTGSLPLTLANRFVAQRGTQISGTADIDAQVTGSLAQPRFGGTVTTANGEVVDPQSNFRLRDISAAVRLDGERAVIERFGGALATGGSVSANGTVGLSTAQSFPADISVTLDSARYADGNLFVATASGTLSLAGGLTANPLLSGDVELERAQISIPNFGGGPGALAEVRHLNAPRPVARTLRRAEPEQQSDSGGGRPSVLQLDVRLNAPNQIFVRGRGLDVELGGSVRLTGSVNSIEPMGGFELIRGRLMILGQRITFTEGRVTLIGDLDPYVDLAARTAAAETTVFVTVQGPASDLDITFSSQPELPQDEVLSLLIFNRALGDLSPLQLAKLAAAAAELAGGGDNSLVSGLREAAGLDNLDIVTDEEGNAALRAGRYIQDNIYLNVQTDTKGDSEVSIDLDITPNLKARGSAASDGETSLGVFFEKDY